MTQDHLFDFYQRLEPQDIVDLRFLVKQGRAIERWFPRVLFDGGAIDYDKNRVVYKPIALELIKLDDEMRAVTKRLQES